MNEPVAEPSPRSAYIHVPFCAHRCGYCNFTLVAGRDYLIERFLRAVELELHSVVDTVHELDTIYLGGGTPSHLNATQIGALGDIIASRFVLARGGEFTAECNPVDLDEFRAAAFGNIGVNRISLGVQSTRDTKLKLLERDHDYQTVVRATAAAKTVANSVSVDLIFAVPGETFQQWKADLEKAIALEPDHFSTYELTFEKGTSYFKRLQKAEFRESGEELRAEMYGHTIERLEQAGYSRYEVSSFARGGHTSRHNSMYWNGAPFFAFGPGAASFLNGVRRNNHRSTTRYLKLVESGQSPVSDVEELSAEAAARELLAIGLRQIDGVDRQMFGQRSGFGAVELFGESLEMLLDNGLLVIEPDRIRLTDKGLVVCDSVAELIVGGSSLE